MADDTLSNPLSATPKNSGGKPGRSGPPGNRHHLTHGWRGYLATGKLPPKCGYLRKQLGHFRNALEAEIVALKGEVSITSAAAIQSVVQHECHRQLLGRWLAAAPADLKLETRVATLDAIARAVDRRDRCLRALELDRADRTMDIFALQVRTPSVIHQDAPGRDAAPPSAIEAATQPITHSEATGALDGASTNAER